MSKLRSICPPAALLGGKGIIGSADSTIYSNRKYDYASIEKLPLLRICWMKDTLEAAASKLEERLAGREPF